MTFEAVLNQALGMLQRQGQVSHRALTGSNGRRTVISHYAAAQVWPWAHYYNG